MSTTISSQTQLLAFLSDTDLTEGVLVNDIFVDLSVFTAANMKKLICSDGYSMIKIGEIIPGYLQSKGNVTDGGFPVGAPVTKDMESGPFDEELVPTEEPSLFPNTAPLIDANIVAGDKTEELRLVGSFWSDWGGDIFDDWGYFYIYDTITRKYYFPIIDPINEADGVLTTQVFNAFGRTFTMIQGYPVEGIFKIDITVSDSLPFRFGAYGNMGSDSDEVVEFKQYSYTLSGYDLTLYYNMHAEEGDESEILYTYVIPRMAVENSAQPYNMYDDGTDMSLVTKAITTGLILYFAKTNDVIEWVVNDLELID